MQDQIWTGQIWILRAIPTVNVPQSDCKLIFNIVQISDAENCNSVVLGLNTVLGIFWKYIYHYMFTFSDDLSPNFFNQ